MTIELKRCPFCGGEAAEPDGNNHTWCSETSCGSDAYLSVEAWNRRTKPGKPESGVLAGIGDLIDRYWQLAYAEGRENRQHDTKAGDAQECRRQIDNAIAALRAEPCEPAAWQGKLTDGSWKTLDDGVASEILSGHLSTEIRPLYASPTSLGVDVEALQRRVEELEAALEFYADELTWIDTNPKDDDRITVLVPSPSFAEIDRGKLAREVLVPWREGAKP